MLHSSLPRAFLPPGLSYLGGYYGDDGHVYTATANYLPCIDDPYVRINEQRLQLAGWEARPASPSPLDLSLKAPARDSQSSRGASLTEAEECEAIEVDDDDDDRRGFLSMPERVTLMTKRSYSNSEEFASGMAESRAEIHRSSSVQSYQSYSDILPIKETTNLRANVQLYRSTGEEISQSPTIDTYTSYNGIDTKKEAPDLTEAVYGSHHSQRDSAASSINETTDYYGLTEQRKLLTTSPSNADTSSYHQQLLLTPQHHHLQSIHAPMTPPSTPSPPQCHRRRNRDESDLTTTPRTVTGSYGSASGKQSSSPNQSDKVIQRGKKKHARKLKFDEDTSSPVSGTVILGPDEAVVTGDIDPAFNIVEVTDEARAELAKIENRLGPYQCKLCRQLHDDAFQLAQHRCSRIAHVEYRCPECDKRFSCPANLASHRRWHKPRMPNPDNNAVNPTASPTTANNPREPEIACTRCDVKFTRAAALRKHLAVQHPETNNNTPMANNNNSNEHDANFDERSIAGKPLCAPVSMHLAAAALTNEIP